MGRQLSQADDENRYALKVTPRRRTSKWSDINRKRWTEIKAAGLLNSAGLAAAPTSNRYAPRPVIPQLPGYLAEALKTNPETWKFFQSLAPTYRRDFVVWIHTAKRAETRDSRIRESIRLLAAGKKTRTEVALRCRPHVGEARSNRVGTAEPRTPILPLDMEKPIQVRSLRRRRALRELLCLAARAQSPDCPAGSRCADPEERR